MTSPSLIVFSFATLVAVVSFSVPAEACPPGSRFSVKQDGTNPVCAVVGVEGLKVRARCIPRPSSGCPLGGQRAKSNQAPGRVYCCPS
jgi:hypothetical protein